METSKALKQLAEFARAKAEGRSMTISGPGVQGGNGKDASYFVSAKAIALGNVGFKTTDAGPAQAAWDVEEAKKHVGKAWRAGEHACMFIVGHYADGHSWDEKKWAEMDWTGHQYAEPKWGTDISEWEWKSCLKRVPGADDFLHLAEVAEALVSGAKVRIREQGSDIDTEYHLGGRGGNPEQLCAHMFSRGDEVISFSFPSYKSWRPEDASHHMGMAFRLSAQGNEGYCGIIGQHSDGSPWVAQSYGEREWSLHEWAQPIWGTCPSTWNWRKCAHITKYVTTAVT